MRRESSAHYGSAKRLILRPHQRHEWETQDDEVGEDNHLVGTRVQSDTNVQCNEEKLINNKNEMRENIRKHDIKYTDLMRWCEHRVLSSSYDMHMSKTIVHNKLALMFIAIRNDDRGVMIRNCDGTTTNQSENSWRIKGALNAGY